jgi:hypothetical protein
LLGLWAVFPGAAGAQPFDLETPADSPLWWTLTDEITPTELRAAYRSHQSHVERYRQAVETGLEEPRSEEALERLKFYINTQLTPELETLGSAFSLFAYGWLPYEDRAATASALAEHGVTAEGAQQVLDIAGRYAQDFRTLADEIGPKHEELIRLQWEILEKSGQHEQSKAELDRALKASDAGYFSEHTGRDETEILGLLDAWKILPSSVLLATTLPDLKAALSAPDWRGLRRYLLYRVSRDLGKFSDWEE